MKSVHLIAGARPNFMKVAPLWHALRTEPWCRAVLVHTGQHYDSLMSDVFFSDLELPAPDFHLGVGSGSHAQQTAAVMVAYEELCQRTKPDNVVVVGDVNSTMACAVVAKKLQLPVSHLEAGLRSFDRSMPEEINRLVTDAIADLLWTPSSDADENLLREGVSPGRIVRVGNIMIDSLVMMKTKIEQVRMSSKLGLEQGEYGVVTLHRPVNVDTAQALDQALSAIIDSSLHLPLVFPMHPRTRARIDEFGFTRRLENSGSITVCKPLGYVEFMSLLSDCAIAATDSGGVQEETCYLGIPCITVRESTERPITITSGTNRLARMADLPQIVAETLEQPKKYDSIRTVPELWDGKTAGRVVTSLKNFVQ